MKIEGFFSICNVIDLPTVIIFFILSLGTVFRRQNLTSKDGPRAEKVTECQMSVSTNSCLL